MLSLICFCARKRCTHTHTKTYKMCGYTFILWKEKIKWVDGGRTRYTRTNRIEVFVSDGGVMQAGDSRQMTSSYMVNSRRMCWNGGEVVGDWMSLGVPLSPRALILEEVGEKKIMKMKKNNKKVLILGFWLENTKRKRDWKTVVFTSRWMVIFVYARGGW